jgi:hypothetical protein
MRKRQFLAFCIVAVAIVALLIQACETTSGTTFVVLLRVLTNGNPVHGVLLVIDGEEKGTTDEDGELEITFEDTAVTTVNLVKKFFSLTSASIDPENDTTVVVEMSAQIFVPDFGNGRVVRIDDMSGTNRSEITSVPGHTFAGPMWVEVDYDNGFIYILDTSDEFSTDAHIIQISDFPPTVSGTKVVHLFNDDWNISIPMAFDDYVRGPSQLALTPSGDILIADMRNQRLVQMNGIDDPSIGTPGMGSFPDTQGVATLPNGKILRLLSDMFQNDLSTMDDIDETGIALFTGSAVLSGPGIDQLDGATRVLVDKAGGHVYISDSGDRFGSSNHRIARYNVDGTSRANYGSSGTGVGQFQNPVILAILPDRRLYIMDVENDRLVRIDSFDTGDSTWQEYGPGGAGTFSFDYWMSFC